MGIVLERGSSYIWTTNTGKQIVFEAGKPIYKLPPDVEEYLLHIGRFRFVPEKGAAVPPVVSAVDETYRKRADGEIDMEGRDIDPITGERLDRKARRDIAKKKQQPVVEISMDENGDPVYIDSITGKQIGVEEEFEEEVATKPIKKAGRPKKMRQPASPR